MTSETKLFRVGFVEGKPVLQIYGYVDPDEIIANLKRIPLSPLFIYKQGLIAALEESQERLLPFLRDGGKMNEEYQIVDGKKVKDVHSPRVLISPDAPAGLAYSVDPETGLLKPTHVNSRGKTSKVEAVFRGIVANVDGIYVRNGVPKNALITPDTTTRLLMGKAANSWGRGQLALPRKRNS
ncbi:MAG: hypothetical protein A2776_03175 [Candidatus Levybacteria bacterium RIFCSPHIGHO2_01_FULL_40_10]|nr:MAG: hypothetical protein A2776_03175 [Candidatus Levybacteria bacterium RIFCSPHIGHO2_01_FULL_40_10]